MPDHNAQVAAILVSIGEDFARLGRLLNEQSGSKVNSRKVSSGKKEKPADAPKKNVSSYLHFSLKTRQRLQEENPQLNQRELAQLTGIEWRGLTSEQKQVYNDMANKDKERYKKEMEAYKARGPSDSPAAAAVDGDDNNNDNNNNGNNDDDSDDSDDGSPKRKSRKIKH
ncbi:high mobility group box domain-containing protein [Chlamydoabsidia padenii]|nr:high mobility group box domain-containing protein [Chlamydoabsidia padenii]